MRDLDEHRRLAAGRFFRHEALEFSVLAVVVAVLGVWILVKAGDWLLGVTFVTAAVLLWVGGRGFRRWSADRFGGD